ncbi:DUF2470 domain-containing protein [Streptomyces sp. cg2]|uniref:DUF2470 domain-containing protein n=1 Tax=Streptomyces sp. cg2 TaxID=3238799 RepID=UPI0034E1B01A
MRATRTRAITPTPAERIRSILTVAHSMTVVSDGLRSEIHRLSGGATGLFHLHAPCEATDTAPTRRVPVRLELTDIAPTSVRDRLRARVTVAGLLTAPYNPHSDKSTCLEFGQAVLEDTSERTYVTLREVEEAELDPLAKSEAEMLTHLVDAHSEIVPLLLRLVRPVPNGVLRALPVAMDRYGITLRLEHPHTFHDVRLPFTTPLTQIEQAAPQIHALLATARRLSHTNNILA